MGSSSETLEKQNRLNSEYPNITSEFLSPPFKSKFSYQDNNLMVDTINKFKPDIVFVGMTCPKQEKWVHQNKNKLDTKLICSIGAVFDYMQGTKRTFIQYGGNYV